MKSVLLVAALLVASVSQARIVVEKCTVQAYGNKIEAVAISNEYMKAIASASMETKINGKVVVSTKKDAQYQYSYGPEAVALIKSEPVFEYLANMVGAQANDISQGITMYTYGNFSDDGAGVVLAVFNKVKGARKSAIFHGSGGFHLCQ